ncbi:SAG-related sequence [Besnoitia besnoiti]|uniref:SAG-related sequence n=1 Tax=Besnoitia besnoiti TaxID=94643 RepID=A0A2A9MC75_BESBE|nr:SAG-related sequence [Besnoitia besnoiti]PFH36088.1 SAG-related sequence [Besnoitia besnoiti]
MDSLSRMTYTELRAPAAAPSRRLQWSSSLATRRHAVVLVSFVCTVFLFCDAVDAVAAKVTPGCGGSDKGAVCTCDETSKAENPLTVIISEGKNTLHLQCKEPLVYAPDLLKKKTVGNAENTTLKCTGGEQTSSCIDIDQLLFGSPTDVHWTDATPLEKADGQSKSLTIPSENLPYVDGQFVVGCTEKGGGNPKCRVAVTVKARASVADGQTVTCAYGTSSNTSHQTVTLSQAKNSFTLVCGEKGAVLPTNYKAAYCSSEIKDGEDTCGGDYKTMLPGYAEKWWKTDAQRNSFAFSIPVDEFPKNEANMVVGCQQKPSSGGEGIPEGVSGSTVCSVEVTIDPSASSSIITRVEGVRFLFVVAPTLAAIASV